MREKKRGGEAEPLPELGGKGRKEGGGFYLCPTGKKHSAAAKSRNWPSPEGKGAKGRCWREG